MNNELIALRNMAWERAKGELRSILQTYWPEYEHGVDVCGYQEAEEKISEFIKDFEDTCM